MLGVLDFTGSGHWAPINFPQHKNAGHFTVYTYPMERHRKFKGGGASLKPNYRIYRRVIGGFRSIDNSWNKALDFTYKKCSSLKESHW